jgi:hypothetical protein
MDDDAAAVASPAPGSEEQDRRPYVAPRLTSYGSLPFDTGARLPFLPGGDLLGYIS